MKNRFSSGWIVLWVVSGLASRVGYSAESPVFHYEIKSEPEGPQPLGFPLRLTGGEPKVAVTAELNTQGLHRGDYDKDSTVWSLPKQFDYKSFHPSALSLTYKNDKLMQVTLVQPTISECQEIMTMIQDAVAYLQSHYTFPSGNAQPAPHYGTNSCVAYMKPGQSGWLVLDGDYAVSVDSNWRDGKEMAYNGFVTFTYLPLYNQPNAGK